MKINVNLIGVFRIGRFKDELREYPTGIIVHKIVDDLLIQRTLIGIILINGRHADLGDNLNDGDTLYIMPFIDGG